MAHIADLGEARPRRVILTFNVPEPALRAVLGGRSWPFELVMVDNVHPCGFGANHNRAFALDRERAPSGSFAVLNPDIRWRANPLPSMLRMLDVGANVGLVYPVQLGVDGEPQDHERLVPTPARLWARYRPGGRAAELGADQAPEWVNAAFVLLRHEAFAAVGGFDEGYYMYCEDVELCLRLQLAGWRLARADQAVVEHAARRASRREPRHLAWHVASLVRLWRSRTLQAWRDRQADDTAQVGPTESR